MNEVKVRILPITYNITYYLLPIIARYTSSLIRNYFKGSTIWWFFAQLYKTPTDCFVLGVLTVRVDSKIRISIAIHEKENKMICNANEIGATRFNS